MRRWRRHSTCPTGRRQRCSRECRLLDATVDLTVVAEVRLRVFGAAVGPGRFS